jgi:predicted DNA-binding WGR domain protein
MKKILKFIDGTSDKFWQIEVSGQSHTVTYGKNGTSGTAQTKSFPSPEECLKSAEKLLAEKIKKGYSDDGQVTLVPSNTPPTEKQAALQAILDEFDQIIIRRKTDALLPFLQEKSKGHVEALKKHIKKCKQYWMTYVELEAQFLAKGRGSWGKRGDEKQERIITLSAIALFDKTEVTTWNEVFWVLNDTSDKVLADILDWGRPNWIEDFLLKRVKDGIWNRIDYHILRRWEENTLINYNPELFAFSLANYTEYNYKNHLTGRDFINFLCNDAVAYERDIPQLFNYETNLNATVFKENEQHISVWATIFNQLLAERKMEHSFFIENALQIQTKNWSNQLKAFFRNSLEDLKPTNEELIPFQSTIFTYFHSPFPPIVTYGAEWVKQLYEHSAFDIHAFLEWVAPVMMRADCKAAIKALFPVFEKIGKNNPNHRAEMALVLADIYVISDMSLQERATKTLLKIADGDDADLKEKLQLYSPHIQGNLKAALSHFLSGGEALEAETEAYEAYQYAPKKVTVLTTPVALPTDWNDILFQFGKFISSEAVVDGEILLYVFIAQQHLFPADYVEQLQPYWKQLQGKYFPSVPKEFIKAFLMAKMVNIDSDFKCDSQRHHYHTKILTLITNLIHKSQDKIKNKSTLPLLSLPTHLLYWVAPKTLVERMIAYQNTKEKIDFVDLSIAIARMPRENMDEAIALLPQLEDEMQQLMKFCFGITDNINIEEASIWTKITQFFGKNNEKIAVWAVAARTFYPTKIFEVFEKTVLKNVPFVASPYNPHFYLHDNRAMWQKQHEKEAKNLLPSWDNLRIYTPTVSNIPDNLLYSSATTSTNQLWQEQNVTYWHSLMPQNPEPLAYEMIKLSNRDNSYNHNELKGYLTVANRPEFWFSEISTFAFAFCFFQEKKEIRLMATEVLMNHIEKNSFDTAKFGEKLAFLVSWQYGVLLRLIDSLVAIKDISPQHNSALFLILDGIFKKLTFKEKIPTNFKKLVEHYMDMLAKTQQKPSPEAVAFLEQWKENTALKALVKQVLERK